MIVNEGFSAVKIGADRHPLVDERVNDVEHLLKYLSRLWANALLVVDLRASCQDHAGDTVSIDAPGLVRLL